MAGPISDRFIDWFRARFPRAGALLFREKPAPTAEASAATPQEPVWYYTEGSERRGPVTPADLRRLYSTGQLRSLSMVWREGMPTWVTISSVEDELPAPPKVKIELPPRRYGIGPGGVFLGLFAAFFVVLVVAVLGANLALSGAGR
jgi:hypothetical protein